jgi:hypothetical protein
MESSLSWLRNLHSSIEEVVEFGCWSSEPFALKVILNAQVVYVIEIDKKNLDTSKGLSPIEEFELLQRNHPKTFGPKSIRFIQGDIRFAPIASSRFDLAFCQDVLYNFDKDFIETKIAIKEMARVVRHMGYLITIEQKLGVSFEKANTFIGSLPIPKSDPIDISELFDDLGLIRIRLCNAPEYSYCFQKVS